MRNPGTDLGPLHCKKAARCIADGTDQVVWKWEIPRSSPVRSLWPVQLELTGRGIKPISEGLSLISLCRGPIQIFVRWGPIQIAENYRKLRRLRRLRYSCSLATSSPPGSFRTSRTMDHAWWWWWCVWLCGCVAAKKVCVCVCSLGLDLHGANV
jgi:hypothetical protein